MYPASSSTLPVGEPRQSPLEVPNAASPVRPLEPLLQLSMGTPAWIVSLPVKVWAAHELSPLPTTSTLALPTRHVL